MFLLGIGETEQHAFYRLEKKLNSMRAGMRSETVCEKWEAKRKDLFNKLGKVMWLQPNLKRK